MRAVIITLSALGITWAIAAIYRLTLSVDNDWSSQVRVDTCLRAAGKAEQ